MQQSRKLDRWPSTGPRIDNRQKPSSAQVPALQDEIDATAKEIRDAFHDGSRGRATLKAKLAQDA
jgi:hypothetical protein